MRSYRLVALQLMTALSLGACTCLQSVKEKQCDLSTPCGSGWQCIDGECFPPGAGGGQGGGAGGGAGGGGVGPCLGCLTSSGKCVAGDTSASCGANGSVCVGCAASEACLGGGCVNTTLCNSANCSGGCCRGATCVPVGNQSNVACGRAAMACTSCPSGASCLAGTCVAPPSCDATSCPAGCCFGGLCVQVAVQSNALCGVGTTCMSCPTGQSCLGGRCTSPSSCDSRTCPKGCCSGNVCVDSTVQTDAKCGLGGLACAACPAGLSCGGGSCSSASGCNASNCGGCCAGSTCVGFSVQSVSNCGSNAQVCQRCAMGQVCANGLCVTGCNSSTCSTGCCDQGKCTPFSAQSSFSCGNFGNTCTACPPGSGCTNGQCAAQVCSSTTCPSGCCQNGFCASGTSRFACGKGGAACTTCSTNDQCTNNACVPAPVKLGDGCTSAMQCAPLGTGAYCKQATSSGNAIYPNGFCTLPCSSGLSACGSSGVCLSALQPYGESDAFCSPRCSNMNQCRTPGYACYFINSASTTACWLAPIPVSGADAGVPDAGSASSIGAACVSSMQCLNPSNADCIPEADPVLGSTGFVGGYCSSVCSGTACPSGSTCVTVSGPGGLTLPLCLLNCSMPGSGQGSCRLGYVCESSGSLSTGQCKPRCTNAGAICPANTICDTATGYCN